MNSPPEIKDFCETISKHVDGEYLCLDEFVLYDSFSSKHPSVYPDQGYFVRSFRKYVEQFYD